MNRPTTSRRHVPLVLRPALILLVAALFLPGCGKKGPPLPPLVKVPNRPETFTARRLGDTVYLQVKVPSVNADATSPASIERVDVYGYTGMPEGNEDIFKNGTLVASIPVRKPPEPESAEPASKGGTKKPQKPEDKPPAPPRPPPSMENGFDQGDTIVVTEPLGPAQYKEVVPKKKKKAPTPKVTEPLKEIPQALGPAPRAPLPARVYVAVGVNRKGQKGAVSARQSVLLMPTASAPSEPDVQYTETSFSIAWTGPADAYPPAGGTGPTAVLKATPIGSLPITGAFNVYEAPRPIVVQPASPPPGAAAGQVSSPPNVPVPPAAGGLMPTPVNATPVPAPPYVDTRMQFGTPRCYAVRAVTLYGAQAVESEASPARCVTPVDTFAPTPPASLRAVGSEGVISLVWDANTEADLAGYIVMRAEIPGGEFKPLTPQPIKEATFNDTTVAKGVRYAYVVVAVDLAGNRSLTSNQVEESAR